MYSPSLEFERPIKELERKIEELSKEGAESARIDALKEHLAQLKKDVFSRLSAMERVQLARHPKRPLLQDYIERIFEEFVELLSLIHI